MADPVPPKFTAFAITIDGMNYAGTIGTTASEGKYPIAVTVPHGTSTSALVATFTVDKGDSDAAVVKVSTTTQTSGTTTNNFGSPVTYSVQDSTTATTKTDYLVTVTVAAGANKAEAQEIIMAGWFPVKKITLKEFSYQSGGFTTPYNVIAVLAVNAPKYTGYVYKDTSGSKPVQKIKLFNGADEASGELDGIDILVLIQL